MSKICQMDLKLCICYHYDICGHSLLLPADPTPYWSVGPVCYLAHAAQLGGICSELPIGVISVKLYQLRSNFIQRCFIYGMSVNNLQYLGSNFATIDLSLQKLQQ